MVDPTSKDNDLVRSPSHYTAPSGIELADVTEHLPFWRGSAMKYIFRAGVKNPGNAVEDLRKAAECIRREIKRLQDAASQVRAHISAQPDKPYSRRPDETLWPPFEQQVPNFPHGGPLCAPADPTPLTIWPSFNKPGNPP